MENVINKYGERLSEAEIHTIANRIRKLSESKIDKLWMSLGFIYKRTQKDYESNDAIDECRINMIKSSDTYAYEMTKNLFVEIHIDLIRKNLDQIEHEPVFNHPDILDNEFFVNEYGEKLSRFELKVIVHRIQKLSNEKIDELWFRVGFIYENKGKNKALHPRQVKKIKETERGAEIEFLKFFDESKIERIKQTLAEIDAAAE